MKTYFSKPAEYRGFERSVNTGYEHIFDDVAQRFLDAVAASLPSRLAKVEERCKIFRAQRGCEWKSRSEDHCEAVPYGEGRMKPVAARAAAGRANSVCKPVFYAATDDKTAISEVRPWIGTLVSVGRFRVLRDLKVVNCADPYLEGPSSLTLALKAAHGNPPTREQVDASVWYDIGAAFAKPVTLDDDPIAYLPTQILAELFKRHGGDGIAYKSSVGEGFNLAIFSLDAVKLECSRVVSVSDLSIEIEEGPFPG